MSKLWIVGGVIVVVAVVAITAYYYFYYNHNNSTSSYLPPPQPPTGLLASNATTNSIDLDWDISEGAIQYIVLKQSENDTAYSVAATVTAQYGQSPQVTVSNLTINTQYSFQVQVVTAAGTSLPCTAVVYLTLPSTIDSLSATSIQSNELILSWNAIPHAVGYQLQYKMDSDSSWGTIIDLQATPTVVDLTNLDANTLYDFQIAAVNSSGAGGFSTIFSVSTLPTNLPARVVGLQASNISNQQTTLTWNAVSGATSYTVQQKLSSADSTNWAFATSVTINSAIVTNLSSPYSYDFRVYATNNFGNGLYSATVSAISIPQGQVTNFTSFAPYYNQVQLSWDQVAGASFYALQYKLSSSGTFQMFNNNIQGTNFTVTGLQPYNSYDFQIVAGNSAGIGSNWSSVLTIQLVTPPAPTITQAKTNDSGVFLQWNAIPGVSQYYTQVSTSSYGDPPIVYTTQTGNTLWFQYCWNVDDTLPVTYDVAVQPVTDDGTTVNVSTTVSYTRNNVSDPNGCPNF